MTRTRLSGLSVQKQIESIISYKIPFTKLVGMTLELQISPDVRPQVFYPAGKYTYTDYSGNAIPAQETKVINTAFEITVGFRFLRVVEYVED